MKKASDVLEKILANLGIIDSKGILPFLAAWEDIVGVDLACHCSPYEIRKNTLIIQSDHPGWSQKFQMQSRNIVAKLGSRFPELGIQKFGYIQNTEAYKLPPLKDLESQESNSPKVQGDKKELPPAITDEPIRESPDLPDILKGRLAAFEKILKERDAQP